MVFRAEHEDSTHAGVKMQIFLRRVDAHDKIEKGSTHLRCTFLDVSKIQARQQASAAQDEKLRTITRHSGDKSCFANESQLR